MLPDKSTMLQAFSLQYIQLDITTSSTLFTAIVHKEGNLKKRTDRNLHHPHLLLQNRKRATKSVPYYATSNGFDNEDSSQKISSSSSSKTYGRTAVINDIIDEECAMKEFFMNRIEWYPIFRTLAGEKLPIETYELFQSIYTQDDRPNVVVSSSFDFHENTSPWKKNVNPIPTNDNDRTVVSKFLDSVHKSLLDIPVTDTNQNKSKKTKLDKETFTTTPSSSWNRDDDHILVFDENDEYVNDYDDNDMHFIEEGRRMLAISRFFVFRSDSRSNNNDGINSINRRNSSVTSSSNYLNSLSRPIDVIDNKNPNYNDDKKNSDIIKFYEELFNLCWSEVIELKQADIHHTGTLILLPDYAYHLSDLRRFTDMNLIRPLQWLGLYDQDNSDAANIFEIVSFQRHSPAIRLLYKLKDM